MANFTVGPHSKFPADTSVGAYAVPGNAVLRETLSADAPRGSAAATATTASDGTTAFTGLADDTLYVAAAQVSGVWRRVQFRTPPTTAAVRATWPTWRARRRALGLV